MLGVEDGFSELTVLFIGVAGIDGMAYVEEEEGGVEGGSGGEEVEVGGGSSSVVSSPSVLLLPLVLLLLFVFGGATGKRVQVPVPAQASTHSGGRGSSTSRRRMASTVPHSIRRHLGNCTDCVPASAL